jgi:3-oxoacyl-[acyl-carrier-protein] synthase-3
MVDTSNEWIQTRTGILERRIARSGDPEESNSSFGYLAAQQALKMAGKRPEDLDQIIYATCTPDTLLPSTACWLQKKLGANRAWAVDLNAACSGFVFGLASANAFIQSGQVRTSLVVGSDILSAFTNWNDRSSCILFGDGAGAAIIEQTSLNHTHRILDTQLRSDGDQWDLFHIVAGGSNQEVTPEAYANNLHKMQMKGKEMFKSAVRTLSEAALEILERNQLSLNDLDWFIPHQANLRILEAVAERIQLPMEKLLTNLERYGNTSSATVPSVLDENIRNGKIRPGNLLLLNVFGAGLTSGTLLMRF